MQKAMANEITHIFPEQFYSTAIQHEAREGEGWGKFSMRREKGKRLDDIYVIQFQKKKKLHEKIKTERDP